MSGGGEQGSLQCTCTATQWTNMFLTGEGNPCRHSTQKDPKVDWNPSPACYEATVIHCATMPPNGWLYISYISPLHYPALFVILYSIHCLDTKGNFWHCRQKHRDFPDAHIATLVPVADVLRLSTCILGQWAKGGTQSILSQSTVFWLDFVIFWRILVTQTGFMPSVSGGVWKRLPQIVPGK